MTLVFRLMILYMSFMCQHISLDVLSYGLLNVKSFISQVLGKIIGGLWTPFIINDGAQ